MLLHHHYIYGFGILEGEEAKSARSPRRPISHDGAFYNFAELTEIIFEGFCVFGVRKGTCIMPSSDLTICCFPIQSSYKHFPVSHKHRSTMFITLAGQTQIPIDLNRAKKRKRGSAGSGYGDGRSEESGKEAAEVVGLEAQRLGAVQVRLSQTSSPI